MIEISKEGSVPNLEQITQNYAQNKLDIRRYFSSEGINPYDEFEWEFSNVDIKNEKGEVIFVQPNSEFPKNFSSLARSVVASRYAYGKLETVERETSLKQIISRVSETYGKWAFKYGYLNEAESKVFADEIAKLTLEQKVAFNSPVWFNVGTDRYPSRATSQKSENYHIENGIAVESKAEEGHLYPQTSACFIQGVEDTMESIMQLAVNEAMLFKYGSGTGTDLSTLRSAREELSGGGKPSGPMAYEKFYDAVAGIVKSGGKTRRAAKMNSLKDWHPDIKEFIVAKANEEKKAKALVATGYSPREASETVAYQNANLSIRVSDEFMHAVENDEEWQTKPVHNKELAHKMPKHKARTLMRSVAESAWECGDPGIQYETTINIWHTSKNSGHINASNPCSEYMFLDDTSCNLTSFNLRKFQKEDGSFDILSFEKGIEIVVPAMDLNYEGSSFPTQKVAQNSYDNRTLGVGYANLGALLMSEGLAYDSDEGRAVAAAITSLMAAKVYEVSTIVAEKLGPFKNFEKNKEPMMEVMRMHKEAHRKNIDSQKLPAKFRPVYERATQLWDVVNERGETYGFRNAQGTVLAPTGTIGFMMDCDTMGIEPELGLIKTKNLSEGGILKIVNQTVPIALKRLGYSDAERLEIEKYLEKHETIEGAPYLKEGHLPVFDCSFKPEKGKRFIDWRGHVKMMVAVQPYLSGAISKTVNMPQESTPEDIEGAYMMGWKLGLKSLAIYRDGSKAWQALETGTKKGLEKIVSPKLAERVKLPNERQSITHKFTIMGHDVYATVGHFPDGKPGELFLSMSKEGSTLNGMIDSFGTSISIGLQHGVPIEAYIKKLVNTNFEPSGFVQEGYKEKIRIAKSIMDYLGKWLGYKYVLGFGQNGKAENEEGKVPLEVIAESEINSKSANAAGNEFTPKGAKSDVFCINCGNNSATYLLGNCAVLCDVDAGGCGFTDPRGCSG